MSATYPVLSGMDIVTSLWGFLNFSGGVPEAVEDWEETDSLLPADVSSLTRAGLSDGETAEVECEKEEKRWDQFKPWFNK